jgi:formylglycine-generating enzyme required for sulfatase activity
MKAACIKTRFLSSVRVLCALCLAVWAAAPRASAQSPPTLGVNLYAGVSITGAVGTVYAIQATTNAAGTNGWSCVALLQLPGSIYIWVDTSTSAALGRRFYRAVVTAANLVYLLPGTFTMGSPTNESLRTSDEAQHVVTISRGFWMGKYEVTQGDYLSVVGRNPSHFTGDPTRPVDQVNWFDATNYCALRTQQERVAGLIPTNYVYRLPTESEWEYADRAGTATAFYLGDSLYSGQANFNGNYEYDAAIGQIFNLNGIYPEATTPAGSYATNGWGLYDMIGNVWEWCQDKYGTYPAGSVTDPQGAVSGASRVARGGSWVDVGQSCRSAQRRNASPNLKVGSIGIRVVLAPGQP